jgi:hypothetical protein
MTQPRPEPATELWTYGGVRVGKSGRGTGIRGIRQSLGYDGRSACRMASRTG